MGAPSETAAPPARTEDAGTEDAVPCKRRKKGLGSFFKATTDQAAGLPLQEDQVIALEIQSYFQTETIGPEKDPPTWWRDAKATSFKSRQEILVCPCHKLLDRESF